MLSTDNKILEEGSEANLRMKEYAGLFEELYIIVVSLKNPHLNPPPDYRGRKTEEGKLFIYSTNSWNKLSALWGAYKIGKRILGDNNVRLPRPEYGARNDNASWVITAQDPFELGLIGYLLKRKFTVPLQLQVHVDFLSPYFWHESLKNKIRVFLAKRLLPWADGIRVVSERIKKSIESSLRGGVCDDAAISRDCFARPRNDKIIVLSIFVDTEKIKNASVKFDLHKKYPQFDFILLMASRLSPEKNIGMAIEAMPVVIKKYPKAGLVIVGAGSDMETLRLRSGNNPNIIFEPWTEDLASYYKTSDLFLLTSLYEGYARTVIEAMAAGLPVIMTDVGLAGDLVKDGQNGYVLNAGDKRGLVERILKLIENKPLREEFSKNNLEAVGRLPSKEEYLKQFRESVFKLLSF